MLTNFSEITTLAQTKELINQFLEENQGKAYYPACKELFQKAFEQGEAIAAALLFHELDNALPILSGEEQASAKEWLSNEVNEKRCAKKTLLHAVLIQEKRFENNPKEFATMTDTLFKYSDLYQPTQNDKNIAPIFAQKGISGKYKTKIANDFGAFFIKTEANATEQYPYTIKIKENNRYYLIPDYQAIATAIEQAKTLAEKEVIISKFEKAMELAHKTLEKHDATHDLVLYYSVSDVFTSNFYNTFKAHQPDQVALEGYLKLLRSDKYPYDRTMKKPEKNITSEELIKLAYFQRKLKFQFPFLTFTYKDEILGQYEQSHFENITKLFDLYHQEDTEVTTGNAILKNINNYLSHTKLAHMNNEIGKKIRVDEKARRDFLDLLALNLDFFYNGMKEIEIASMEDALILIMIAGKYCEKKDGQKVVDLLSKLGDGKKALWLLSYLYTKFQGEKNNSICKALSQAMKFLATHHVEAEQSYYAGIPATYYINKIENNYQLKQIIYPNKYGTSFTFTQEVFAFYKNDAVKCGIGLVGIAAGIGIWVVIFLPTSLGLGIAFSLIAAAAILPPLLVFFGTPLLQPFISRFEVFSSRKEIRSSYNYHEANDFLKTATLGEVCLQPVKDYFNHVQNFSAREYGIVDDVFECLRAFQQIYSGVVQIVAAVRSDSVIKELCTGLVNVAVGLVGFILSPFVTVAKMAMRYHHHYHIDKTRVVNVANKAKQQLLEPKNTEAEVHDEESALLSVDNKVARLTTEEKLQSLRKVTQTVKQSPVVFSESEQEAQKVERQQAQKAARQEAKKYLLFAPKKLDSEDHRLQNTALVKYYDTLMPQSV